MELQQMNFENKDIKVSVIPREAYALSPEKREIVKSYLPKLLEMEYWDPVFQAWGMFLKMYLRCGCDFELTEEFAARIFDKSDNLAPPHSQYHWFFASVKKFYGSACWDSFGSDVTYKDIVDACAAPVLYYLQYKNNIIKELRKPDLSINTMKAFLEKGTWSCVARAFYLFRHRQMDSVWPEEIIRELNNYQEEWVERYTEAFNFVKDLVSEKAKYYNWYCDVYRDVICRSWITALHIGEGREVVRPKDLEGLTNIVSESLIENVNNSPVTIDIRFTGIRVWDSLCNLYFSDNPRSPLFLENAFQVLCVPYSYIRSMCKTLEDFYEVVRTGDLTNRMYQSKVVQHSENSETEDPETYLENLYWRGFPEIRKE